MARPISNIPTESRTWRFYSDDIKEVLNMDQPPKNLLRLGIQAYKQGFNKYKSDNETDELKERIRKLSLLIDESYKRINLLGNIVSKQAKVGLQELESESIEALEEKLKVLEKKKKSF